MTPREHKILCLLAAAAEPVSRAAIDAHFGWSTGSANDALDRLRAAGMVSCQVVPAEPSQKGPRERKVYAATAEGVVAASKPPPPPPAPAPTPKPKPKPKASKAKDSKPVSTSRDTRPVVPLNRLTAAVTAAADAIGRLGGEHLPLPENWGELRSKFHVLPDKERRAAILRLLSEENGRVAHDRASAWNGGPG